MSKYQCDKQGGLGTMQGGQMGWGQTREGRRPCGEAPKMAEGEGSPHVCTAVWGEGALQRQPWQRRHVRQRSEPWSVRQEQHLYQTRDRCCMDWDSSRVLAYN